MREWKGSRNGRRAARAVLTLAICGHSVQAGYAPQHSPLALDFAEKTDLASILRDPPIQQHERLSEALQIIHPIQSGPRCHYQAALHLLNDCKFLENSSPDVKAGSEASLDDLETVYAARLAVCELMSANAAIPPDCKVVAASKGACVRKRHGFGAWFSQQEQSVGDRLCYPEANPRQFRRCMTAIFGQPQAWMSYSNARQNAVVMCHASRDVIEKEKNLAHYKSMGEAVSLMASVLEQYNEQIKAWLNEHDTLVAKIRTSSEQVLQDMHEGLSTFDSIRNAFRSFAGMMYSTSESYSDEISKSLARSKADMEEHRREMQEQHKNFAETSLQHANTQRNQLQENHHAAVTALQSYHFAALKTLQHNHLAALSRVEEVASTIEGLQDKVEITTSNLIAINQGLENVNRTVQHLDAVTERLPEVLQALSSFGKIFTNLRFLLGGTLCFFGLWKANGKLAGLVMTIGGFSYLVSLANISKCAGVLRQFISTSIDFAIENQTPILLVIAAFGVVCLLSFILHLGIRTISLSECIDEHGEKAVLPSIERAETPGPLPTPITPPRRPHRTDRYGLLGLFPLAS